MKNKYIIILMIFGSILVSQLNHVNQTEIVSSKLTFSSEPYVNGDDGICECM